MLALYTRLLDGFPTLLRLRSMLRTHAHAQETANGERRSEALFPDRRRQLTTALLSVLLGRSDCRSSIGARSVLGWHDYQRPPRLAAGDDEMIKERRRFIS